MLWMFRSGSEIRKIAFPVFVNCNHEGVFNPLTRDVVLIRSNHERGSLACLTQFSIQIEAGMKCSRLLWCEIWSPRHKTPSRSKEITKNSVWLNYIGWHLLNCRSTYCWMTPVSVNVSRVICERGAGSYWSAEEERKISKGTRRSKVNRGGKCHFEQLMKS